MSQEFDFLALGGGALETPEILEELENNESILLVYLEAKPQTIVERVKQVEKQNPGTRPLLYDESGIFQEEKLITLLQARRPNYERSNLTIVTDGLNPATVAQLLNKLRDQDLNQWNKSFIVPADFGTGSVEHVIGTNSLQVLPEYLANTINLKSKIAIFVDENVDQHFGPNIETNFRRIGWEYTKLIVPSGESNKSFSCVQKYCNQLAEEGFSRQDSILAIGGGVTGDLIGLVASTYLRGIRLVHVPTTVVSQVDSAIGGKTGINLPSGKNLVGTFYPASLVWSDVDLLQSLPEREYLSGLAEVVKYGAILDEEFFRWIEENITTILARDSESLLKIVKKSSLTKISVVNEDLHDLTGSRARLNYGHTFGHAVEKLAGYGSYLHGEAVSIGMVVAAKIAERLELSKQGTSGRLTRLLESLNLPVQLKLEDELQSEIEAFKEKILKANCDKCSQEDLSQLVQKENIRKNAFIQRWAKVVRSDKKSVSDQTGFIVLPQIGESKVELIDVELLTMLAGIELDLSAPVYLVWENYDFQK